MRTTELGAPLNFLIYYGHRPALPPGATEGTVELMHISNSKFSRWRGVKVWRGECQLWCRSRHLSGLKKLRGSILGPWVVWWLEHRTPDRKAWVRCPMPPNTLRVHTEYVLIKSGSPKVLWAELRVHFGEFRRANSYCPLYGAQDLGQRHAYF
ncbi:uncharacterized protein TNCV_2007591 [Trichonephila clavipes]|nr:uncharacterized protein TNCV_2007591 [Trichonephila clavipes]